MSITTEATNSGVLIRFPYDREMVAALKKKFPKARWNPATATWTIDGVTAERRVAKWLEEMQQAKAEAAKAEIAAKESVANEMIKSKYISKWNVGWAINVPYSDAIVKLIRSIPTAQFHRSVNGGYWLVPFRSTSDLQSVLPKIEALADPIISARDAEEKRREAARKALAAEWEQERRERIVKQAERRANRFVVLAEKMPQTGKAVRMYGQTVVIESFGKWFRVDDDMPSMWGSHLLGHEGERCCYAYWRDATSDEIAELEECERVAASRAEEYHAATDEMYQLEGIARASGEYPEGHHRLDGETLLEINRRLRIYGGGSWWVAASDGLWFVRNNGADGDAWDHNNVLTGGAGAIGLRLPRNAGMESQLRRIATILKEE